MISTVCLITFKLSPFGEVMRHEMYIQQLEDECARLTSGPGGIMEMKQTIQQGTRNCSVGNSSRRT
jgi:hypothetical protein